MYSSSIIVAVPHLPVTIILFIHYRVRGEIISRKVLRFMMLSVAAHIINSIPRIDQRYWYIRCGMFPCPCICPWRAERCTKQTAAGVDPDSRLSRDCGMSCAGSGFLCYICAAFSRPREQTQLVFGGQRAPSVGQGNRIEGKRSVWYGEWRFYIVDQS